MHSHAARRRDVTDATIGTIAPIECQIAIARLMAAGDPRAHEEPHAVPAAPRARSLLAVFKESSTLIGGSEHSDRSRIKNSAERGCILT